MVNKALNKIIKGKKILILGGKGLLGSEIAKTLNKYNTFVWDREDCDLLNFNKLTNKIIKLSPDIIINASGYTDVDNAEEEYSLANDINGYAVTSSF